MTPEAFLRQLDEVGTATPDDLARGMHLSYENAYRLLRDAAKLLKASPERALALAILAMEEAGKIFVLFNAAVTSNGIPVPWAEIRKAIRKHGTKQQLLAAYGQGLPTIGVRLPEDSPLRYETPIPGGLVALLDRFKQLCLYVDFTSVGFIAPKSFGAANREWARWAIQVTRERLRSLKPIHGTARGSQQFTKDGLRMVNALGRLKAADDTSLQEAVRRFIRDALRDSEKAK
jgi:AbiV family abortive infection protein